MNKEELKTTYTTEEIVKVKKFLEDYLDMLEIERSDDINVIISFENTLMELPNSIEEL